MKVKAILRYYPYLLGAIGLGIVLTIFTGPEYKNSGVQLAPVSYASSFDIKVNTVGVLDAARSHMVSSAIRGDKGKLIYLVDDGTRVKKGDILAKLDPTPFEEDVLKLTGEVNSLESAVEALEQVVEWERNQMEREYRSAEFNVRVAGLELDRLEKGEGPLQLSQYTSEMNKAKQEYTRYLSYIKSMEDMIEDGYDNTIELAQAREKFEQLKDAYEQANEKYLSFKDYVLPSKIETAKARLQKAEMELEQTEKGSIFKVAKSVAAVEKAKRELENAKITLKQSGEELNKTVIRAPFSAIAILFEAYRDNKKRKPRVGDTVWQNQPLLYLPDISSMIVKTQVREVDLHKITIGQKCSVQVDAYHDLIFEGEVSYVGVLATERFEGRRGEKYFQLTISVNDQDTRLRPGMTARVSILTSKIRDALSVPVQAIFYDEAGLKFCYLQTKRGFRKVGVAVGSQNEDVAEIIHGLKKGNKVSLVKPPNEEIIR